ncbi:transposase, partial [Escherichia coli]|nr:transposase [Escherichia coli]
VIYLPDFETKPMVKTKGRKIGRKAVHDMLSLSHYKFKEFLLWTAEKYGKEVIIVDESYTSKTQSWNGIVNEKLGSSRTMKDGTRIIDRDINGARNIYLKHVSQLTNI